MQCQKKRMSCRYNDLFHRSIAFARDAEKTKLQFLSSLIQSENSVIAYISSLRYNSQQSSFFASCRE